MNSSCPPHLNKAVEYLNSYTKLLGGIALGLTFHDRLDKLIKKFEQL